MKREQHILHLDPDRLIVYCWRAHTIHVDACFMVEAAGLAAFSGYIRQHPQRHYTLLADLSEEEFRREQIPRLRGSERRAVIERRLRRHFRDCPYKTEQPQGHDKSRRHEEHLLLAALTAPEQIQPWLTILDEAGAVLRAIHSQAMLAPILLKHLSGTNKTALLLTIQGNNLRQSYLEQGQLHFSRRSPIAGDEIEIAETVAIEAGRICQYLRSQLILGHSQPMHAIVIAEPALIEGLRKHCPDNQMLTFQFQAADELAPRLGYTLGNNADSFCTAAYVHLLATEPPRHQFAGPETRHHHRLQRTRSTITACTALVSFACLLFTGLQWFRLNEMEVKADLVRKEITISRQYNQAIEQAQAELPVAAKTLQAITQRQTEILQHSPLPTIFLRELSRILDRFPTIEIDRLEWKVVSDIGTSPPLRGPDQIIRLHGRIQGAAPAPATAPEERQSSVSLQQFVSALDGIALLAVNTTFQPAFSPSISGQGTMKSDNSPSSSQGFVLEIMKRGTP